ncbi:DNA adenine methylase [Trinickia mobilis]|uniref:DNA adenine methylase n=1 Tax=Trinickia mobilis TaxID=2816356 RepID=UPI001A909F64|nr:DNA adenine methylase [Trinickia mobilis]
MQKHPVFQAARPTKPFLKWVGGKSRVLQHIVSRLPRGRRLIEPFVGGGAVFLGSDFEEYLLADKNAHLIELYQEVSTRPHAFIELAQTFFDEEYLSQSRYLEVRAAFNAEQDRLMRAAQFLYLNKFGFNGLCRYNRSGIFNVPYGRPARTPRLPVAEILAFSEKAKRATFYPSDFVEVMASARPGDVVYCDPPYLDRDDASSFEAYSATGFDVARQRQLADLANDLAAYGVPVVISNHDCSTARELYAGAAEIHPYSARRSVSAARDKRGAVAEIVAVFR